MDDQFKQMIITNFDPNGTKKIPIPDETRNKWQNSIQNSVNKIHKDWQFTKSMNSFPESCKTIYLGSGAGGDAYKVGKTVIKCFWCCANPEENRTPFTDEDGQLKLTGKCKKCQSNFRDINRGLERYFREREINQIVINLLSTPPTSFKPFFSIDNNLVETFTPLIPIKDGTKNTVDIADECNEKYQEEFNNIPHVVSRGGTHACDLLRLNIKKKDTNPIKRHLMNDDEDEKNRIQSLFVDNLINCLFSMANLLKQNELYHHDIKPQNIFISMDEKNTIKVVLGDYDLLGVDVDTFVGTRGFAGYSKYNKPNFVKTFEKSQVREIASSYNFNDYKQHPEYSYYKSSWNRTLYSIARTLHETADLKSVGYRGSWLCEEARSRLMLHGDYCLWRLMMDYNNDSPKYDLTIEDVENMKEHQELINSTRNFLRGVRELREVRGGILPAKKYMDKSVREAHQAPADKFKEFKYDRNRYHNPNYYNDCQKDFRDPEEYETYETIDPWFDMPIIEQIKNGISKTPEDEKVGGSKKKAMWLSAAFGAMVTVMVSLVKR